MYSAREAKLVYVYIVGASLGAKANNLVCNYTKLYNYIAHNEWASTASNYFGKIKRKKNFYCNLKEVTFYKFIL